jgi:hypothetical protein
MSAAMWALWVEDAEPERFRTPTGKRVHIGVLGSVRDDGSTVLHSACGMGAHLDARDVDWTEEDVTCRQCLLYIGARP